MIKDDPGQIKYLLNKFNFTPVYSDESLKEVQRSVGFEVQFLELLEEIEALYIEPIFDRNFKHTGQAKLHVISPKSCYENFLNNLKENLLNEIDGLNEEDFEADIDLDGWKSLMKKSLQPMTNHTITLPVELEEAETPLISAFEKETGIGPIILNNIKPPRVVIKIWDRLVQIEGFAEQNIEEFFGVKQYALQEGPKRNITPQEKVNSVYHQLNFLGYHRDSKMKKERRFKASMSDMTHAGIASYCDLFFSRDEDLVMKAAAAYEFVGVTTKILHYKF